MLKKTIYLLTIGLFICGCGEETEPDDPMTTERPNILLIIADDMGKDATAGFAEGSIKPTTPHLNEIRDAGLQFNNFWSYPTCTPTRASIITGKYGYRTGVKQVGDVLSSSESILHKELNERTFDNYATAIVGKWHLSGNNSSGVDPELFGMDYYAGLISGAVQNYYMWMLSENGSSTTNKEYITTVFTDLAIDWLSVQEQPWFLWLAYNAPHTPFHVPPAEMHSQGELPEYSTGMDATPYYMAAIEAMDFQIGRLLNSLSEEDRENTLILFIGDNGTPGQVAQAPYSNTTSKGSLYQGGINVPMYVSGKGVSRTGSDNNLITASDLFATVLDAAGTDISSIHDSKSIIPLLTAANTDHRIVQYAESVGNNEESWTISNGEYKLLVKSTGEEEMYNLEIDPYESNNLLDGDLSGEEEDGKALLESELAKIRN